VPTPLTKQNLACQRKGDCSGKAAKENPFKHKAQSATGEKIQKAYAEKN
jgi:hypothetical protein